MDNAGITTVVAQACAATGTQLAYASTSEVYGDLGDAVAYEDGRRMALPHNLYGLSKRWGEEACRLYAPDGLVLLRFSMPYGPGHPPGRGRAALTNILDQADRNQPIPIHRDSERSWCWVGDTARATRMILEAAAEQPRWHGGAWNVGRDDNATPMLEIAEKACDLVGAPRALIKLVDPPGRQTVVKRLSTDRLRRLGWEPVVDIDDGMRRVLEYVRSLPRELHSTTEGVR